MSISAKAVKELRDRTGAGMMDCKKALVDTDGDLDEAIKVLRTKGLAAAGKKAHRTASDGTVVVTSDVSDVTRAIVLELNCETDFVARNSEFAEFAQSLSQQALADGIDNVETLLGRPYASEPEHTVEQMISQKVATIGENIVLSRLKIIVAEAGNQIAEYVHGGGKIGVAVEGSQAISEEALHDVALHIAASEPRFVTRDEVTDEVLATEREIAIKQAVESGKPEHIAERIVSGKMEKFFEQEVLLEQPFAKDPSKSVGEYIRGSGGPEATVERFVRFRLGEAVG